MPLDAARLFDGDPDYEVFARAVLGMVQEAQREQAERTNRELAKAG